MVLETWSMVFSRSLQDLWLGVADFLPQLIVAILIFVVGWLVGSVLEKVIEQLFKMLKVDSALKQAGVHEVVSRSGMDLNSGVFVGSLVKWFVVIVFLVASFDVLKLTQVNDFLKTVAMGFLPNVIVAVLMLLVGAMIAEAMKNIISAGARAAEVKHANFLGAVAKWAIWVFAALVALTQLGVAVELIKTLFTGIIFALSLGLALAFGLGGRDAASDFIQKTKKEMSDR